MFFLGGFLLQYFVSVIGKGLVELAASRENPHFSQKDPSRGKTQQSHKEKLMIAGLTIFTNPLIFILFCLLNVSILFCFALLCFYFAFSFVHFVMCFCLILRFFVSFVSFVYYYIVYLQQPLDNRTVTVSM